MIWVNACDGKGFDGDEKQNKKRKNPPPLDLQLNIYKKILF